MVIDLRAELLAAVAQLGADDRAELIALGVPADDLYCRRLCGLERVSAGNGLYAPAPDGAAAIITPVRLWHPVGPEAPRPRLYTQWGPIVDLIAWHPADPERWVLRTGAAEWLGCIEPQFMDPDPVPVHRSVLDWLRAGRVGLVLLSDHPMDQYRVLSCCRNGVVAADDEHGRQLRRVLSRPWPHPAVEVADAVTA